MSLSSRILALYSSNLHSSVRSPQCMAISACWEGFCSDWNSIPWVSERMRNRVLTEVERLVESMMLSGMITFGGNLGEERDCGVS